MHSIARFVSAIVQDRIVYATLAWSSQCNYYVGISRTKIHLVKVLVDPIIESYRYKELLSVIVDVNDENALMLSFTENKVYTLQTQEREELLREMALRYSTIQKYDTLLSVDFPIQCGSSLVEGERAPFPIEVPRAPQRFFY